MFLFCNIATITKAKRPGVEIKKTKTNRVLITVTSENTVAFSAAAVCGLLGGNVVLLLPFNQCE